MALTRMNWKEASGRIYQPIASNLLSVMQDWFKHLEKRQDIGAVFFDFHKAFDSVPHMPLVEKLHKFGLHPYVMLTENRVWWSMGHLQDL